MRAVVRAQGMQILATEGAIFHLNRFPGRAAGDVVELTEVLLLGEGADARVGTPLVPGAVVRARILENRRGKKVFIMKRLRRKGLHKKRGHRQELSILQIESIVGD
ncbi:MAG: 50S ribosomal protein L21 [Puniceicoccales bacterium]|jgi:large subunit ribosomal protein L21|nr:50S ribosomal protein L21 [Puniceicoccales bacterium]